MTLEEFLRRGQRAQQIVDQLTNVERVARDWIEAALRAVHPDHHDPRGFAEHLLALCEEHHVRIEDLVEAMYRVKNL
jgi:hypothetical protein